jgi:diguanylate cyclase (GGDEF)-like protein
MKARAGGEVGSTGCRRAHPTFVLWCALQLVGLVSPALALDPTRRLADFVMRSWNIENGLPQSSVNAVLQDRNGYLWVGTQEGLARFDGVRFVVYDTRTEPAFVSSFVICLLEDRRGRLWVGTQGGGVVVRENGTFRRFSVEEGLPSSMVQAVAEDPEGRIWIATEQGVARIEGETVERPNLGVELPNANVYALACEEDGGLWLGTYGGGLLHVHKGGHQLFTAPAMLPDNVILRIYRDRPGRIWVGMYDGGLAMREGGAWRFFTRDHGLGSNRITDIKEDRDGTLWVGTYGGGLSRRVGDRFESVGLEEGLPSNVVVGLGEDREGNLWVGTETGGLTQMRAGKFLPFTTRHGLKSATVFATLEDSRGDMWLGTVAGGLVRVRGGEVRAFTPAEGFPSEHIGGLAEGRDGTLWVGIRTGLVRMRDERWEIIPLPGQVQRPFVWAVHEDGDGSLWLGTDGGGLHHRLPNGRFEVFTTDNGLPNNVIRAIIGDSSRRLWVATAGGLVSKDAKGFRGWGRKQGLPSEIIDALYEDPRGALWVGTGAGLARVEGDLVTCYDRGSGLPDQEVLGVLEDDIGFLWLAYNKGLVRVPKSSLEAFARGDKTAIAYTRFGAADGMPSTECNGGSQPPAWKRRDGTLWFPTTKGIAVVRPNQLPTNMVAPPVLIEQVQADGHPLASDRQFEIPAGTRRVEINYTALSLVDPERVHFRVRLAGLDRVFLDVGNRRVANFAGLAPGSYRFEVQACNEDGIWNEVGARVEIVVGAYFWQTAWFRALALVLVAAAAALFLAARIRAARLREHELQGLVEERTGELQRTNRLLEDQGSRLAQANRMLQRLAAVDSLTSTANRRRFDTTLKQEWRRAVRSQKPLSLLMVDIDFFKAYNDHYGHQQGDECLRRVSEALGRGASRPGDLVARYGGEEFAILLADTDRHGANTVAEKVRSAVEELRIGHDASTVESVVTVSIGVATQLADKEGSTAILVALADAALYEAKRGGRNRVEVSVVSSMAPAPSARRASSKPKQAVSPEPPQVAEPRPALMPEPTSADAQPPEAMSAAVSSAEPSPPAPDAVASATAPAQQAPATRRRPRRSQRARRRPETSVSSDPSSD